MCFCVGAPSEGAESSNKTLLSLLLHTALQLHISCDEVWYKNNLRWLK